MGRKKKIAVNPDVADRFIHLFGILFESNQNRMAQALGVSQTVVSKIIRGQQIPGSRVLAALAGHSRVNPNWLYTGEGEPLVVEKGNATQGYTLPIARSPLPGLPRESPELLTRDSFPVAAAHFAVQNYYLQIQQNDPIVRWSEYGIRPGDLLLMEPREANVRVERLDRRLAIATCDGKLQLGELRMDSDDSGTSDVLSMELLETGIPASKLERDYILRIHTDCTPRIIERLTRKVGKSKLRGTVRQASTVRLSCNLSVQDIVSVCVLCVRDYP